MEKDGLAKLNHPRQENKAKERSNLRKDVVEMYRRIKD